MNLYKAKLLEDIRTYPYEPPNINSIIETWHNDYIKFRNPEFNTRAIEPPDWYIFTMSEKIVEYALLWHDCLNLYHQEIDLQIWLFRPYFNESQIVAAKKVVPGEPRNNFFVKSTETKLFPFEYFGLNKQFVIKWENNLHTHLVFDWEIPSQYKVAKLKREGYTLKKEYFESSGREVEYYELILGDVWVGRIPQDNN